MNYVFAYKLFTTPHFDTMSCSDMGLDRAGPGFTLPPNMVDLILDSGRLILPCCNLRGEIPDSIGQLTNVIRLNLSCNKLTGNIPSSLGNLTNLERLNLGGNELTGPIPTSFSSLQKLGKIYLNNNNLSGKMFWTLAACLSVCAQAWHH